MTTETEKVAELCRLIERSDEPPRLADLAKRAGASESHTHRLFKRITGLTPKAYAAAVRAQRARAALERAETVTAAIYEAGYNSSGRFYESATERLGMTPTELRARGAGLEIQYAFGASSLGSVLVAATDRGVCAILLGDDREALAGDLGRRFPKARLGAGDERFSELVARVIALVEDPARGADLPLDIRGTAFQERVWRALARIPAGTTVSYTEIARSIGAPRSARAVARACADNPAAVAIPCHRVVRSDGALSGYRWGVERKRALQARERERSGASDEARDRESHGDETSRARRID